MEKLFSSFESKTQNQKIIIGLSFSAVTLFLLALSYLLTTPKINPQENKSSQSNSETSPAPVNPASKSSFPNSSSGVPGTVPVSIPKGWETYKYTDFEISYPSNFSVQFGAISGGGVSLAFAQKPSTLAVSQGHIEMQVYDAKNVPLGRISEGFTGLGYTKSAVTIGEINAQKFSDSITATTSASLHTSAVIFANKGKTFKIQLDYTAQGQDSQIENTYNQIVSTFRFAPAQ